MRKNREVESINAEQHFFKNGSLDKRKMELLDILELIIKFFRYSHERTSESTFRIATIVDMYQIHA